MTRPRGTDRRETIVQAAFEVIAERGYRGSSLGAVAERVGLTQQGVTHYFPSKEQLLLAVLERRDQWDLMGFSRSEDASALGAAHLQQLVEYNATRPSSVRAYTVLAADSVTEDHPARQFFQERYTRVRAWVADLMERQEGELPAGLTAEQLAPIVIAVLDGLQLQWLLDPDEVDMPESFRDFLAVLGIKV